jgi:hypothetical protein
MQQHEQALLILIVPIKLEELMVDQLLQASEISGFTSSQVFGHGSFKHAQLSLAEQVSGRQRRIQFMLHGQRDALQKLLENLKSDFADAGLHYVLQPVLDAGEI